MEFLHHFITTLVGLRWILILIGVAVLAWLYAEALADIRTQAKQLRELRETLAARDESIRRLRVLVAAQRLRSRRHAPLLAGRVRQ